LRLQTSRFPRETVYAFSSAIPLTLVIGIAATRVHLFKACSAGFGLGSPVVSTSSELPRRSPVSAGALLHLLHLLGCRDLLRIRL
jgi:hypothetical protein